LDRFAQFFVEPLFLEDTLDRELRSVDSENKKNLQSDSWRLHQLQSSLGNPNHPYCQFSTGNWETLHDEPLAKGLNLRDEFMKFYETHYSANRMKLVVLGRESLDVLQNWSVELFSPVKNKDLPRLEWNGIPLYTQDALLTQVFAKPVLDTRSMDLYFSYPDEEDMYDSQPSRYLSHLIGHEGPGSILAYVKEKGWVNDLSAGAMDVCPGAAYFNIHVRLTDEGLENYQEVVKIIFQYISMLNEHPPLDWVYQELKVMTEVDFKFKQNSSASSTASGLSSYMPQPWPRDRLLSCAAGVLRKFEPKLIAEGLAHLRPENFRLAITCQETGGWDKKERWYGTEYKFEKIPENFVSEIQDAFKSSKDKRPDALHLPHQNEFIPTRLEVDKKEVAQPAKTPKLIRNDEHVRTWYKKDDQFWVPKALVNIVMRSPLAYVTPRCTLMAQMYCALVQDALNEYSYDADIAGLEYSLGSDILGPQISLKGYNDKMAVLLEKILTGMKTLQVSEARFKIIKERWVRGFKNWFFKQPYHQVGTYRTWLTADKLWITEQFQTEIATITASDVQEYYPQLLEQLHIEVLATGNLRKEDAREFTDLTESILKPRGLPQSLWPIRRSLIVPSGTNTLYEQDLADPENINHCIEYVCYSGSCRDVPLRAQALLFAQIADEPCYDQLRTKEQLGYIVFSTLVMNLHRMGFRVLVQSEKSPEELEDRIEAFLDKLGKDIAELDDIKFDKQKQSLISKIKEKPKNLKEEFGRFWGNIITESFDFDERKSQVPSRVF
jgi:insulysin